MPAGDERGDHLGVGGDLGREVQAVERLEVGVVVDVAVERGDRRTGRRRPSPSSSSWFSGCAFGLGDDADARPARVREHRRLARSRRAARGAAARRRGSAARSARGVVAELTDLGRGLVDEREVAVGDAHRARREQRVGGARRDRARAIVGSARSRPWPAHEHVQAGRVAAAHLEPVERRQRDLHRVERLERGRTDGVAGRRGPRPRAPCASGRCGSPTPRPCTRSARR